MNVKSSPNNAKSKVFSFFQKRISLKLEDKILLGIGGLFLMGIIAFVAFANTIFKSFETPRNSPVQETLIQSEKTAKEMDNAFETPFKEFEDRFQKLGEILEEDQRRQDKSFQKAEKNFHDRFEKSKETFKK